MPSGRGDSSTNSKRTNATSEHDTAREDKKDNLSLFLDNQTLRTNPFGDNISAEYLYRRAERIAAAVHLITGHVRDGEPARDAVREESLRLLRHALSLRSELRASGSENVRKMQESIRELISLIRVLGIAGHASSQNVHVIVEALDELGNLLLTSQRSVLAEAVSLSRSDLVPQMTSLSRDRAAARTKKSSLIRSASPIRQIKDSVPRVKDNQTSRTDRILDILRTGGVLGIKDIASNLPEYSEKMIQRDLANLSGQNMVKKTGAKRWSRYEIVQ